MLLLHRTLSALTLFPLLSLTDVVSHLLTHSSRTPVSSLDLILLSYLNYPSGSFPNLSFLVQDGPSPMPVFPVAGGISPSFHSSISLLPATSYPESGLALSPENRFFLQPPFSTGECTQNLKTLPPASLLGIASQLLKPVTSLCRLLKSVLNIHQLLTFVHLLLHLSICIYGFLLDRSEFVADVMTSHP